MSTPSKLQYVSYEAEAGFCEDVSTFANRLPIIGEVDTSGLAQKKQNVGATVQHLNDGAADAFLPFTDAEFRIRVLVTGLGSSAAGAIAANDLVTLLGLLLGASEATSVGTTADGTGTATAFGVAAGTFSAGRLFRLGALNDGRGGGQAGVVSGLSGGTLTSLVAAAAAPNNNDVVYAMATIHALEAIADSAHLETSLRFRVASAAGRWNCHGCWLKGIGLTNWDLRGGIAEVELTIGTALPILESASTWPTADAVDHFAAPAFAGGSFHISDVGTATRNALAVRNLDIQLAMETIPLMGPGGRSPYQVITGVRRLASKMTLGFSVDAGAAADVVAARSAWLTEGMKQILITFAAEDSRAVALYAPRCKSTMEPQQVSEDGMNRLRYAYEALTGSDDSNAVTQSSWRIGIG